MYEGERRDGTSSNDKGNTKAARWPDVFHWLVKFAEKLVGSNDAKDVANAALYDFCCSDRPRPSTDNRKETKYLLRRLVRERARALWKNEKRRRPEVLSRFDPDELHVEVHQRTDENAACNRLMLDRALSSLSAVERDLVLGYYVDEFTAEELAREHKMNPNTVQTRIKRTLPRMADALRLETRQPRRLSGLMIFATWKREQWAAMRQAFSAIRAKVWSAPNWVRLGQCLVACAPLAVLPVHTFVDDMPIQTLKKRIQRESLHAQESPPIRFHPAFDWTNGIVESYAPSSPELAHRATVAAHLAPRLSPVVAVVPNDEEKEAPKMVEAVVSSPVNECQNTLGLAIAKKNVQQWTDCLDVLEGLRLRDADCAQSEDWQNLHTTCRQAMRTSSR